MSASRGQSWTDAQRDAITSVGSNLLVSAAAGSGKTSVLAERCAQLICHASNEHRCDVDELLVVTFTRAAAAEMRSRIEQTLRRLVGQSDDPRLRRQLRLIDRAQIGTLHSFCAKILRRHFNLPGLDPAFTTLDDKDAVLLRNEVMSELLERKYDNDTDGAFQQLVESHFAGDDGRLREAVLRTHGVMGSLVDPVAWSQEVIERLETGANDPFDQSELGRELTALLASHLSAALDRARALYPRLATLSPAHADNLAEIESAVGDWHQLLASDGYEAAAAHIRDFKMPRSPTVKPQTDESKRARDLLEKFRKPLNEGWFATACRFKVNEWQSGLAAAVAPARQYLGLVDEFDRAYEIAKRALRVVDFSDLERLTLRVLRDPCSDAITPSAAAKAYRSQFKYVLVDEFQDINQLQDQILRLLSRDGPDADATSANFFCVGDVKQSIYRFRLADPAQFLARARRYRNGGPRERVIDLSENFRSDPPVLETVNALFRRLMTEPAAEIDYDDSHALRAGKAQTEYSPLQEPVELHILPAPPPADSADAGAHDFDATEREAAVAADLILRLTSATAKPRFAFGDVAVLLRAMKVKAEKFAAILRRFGVPVHADSSSGLFESTEIRDMLSLLRCLDNPRQDIPLASLLRSPLIQLPAPEDSLAMVRLKYRSAAFNVAVVRYSIEQRDELARRLKQFTAQLDAWRDLANLRPIAAVIWQILNETGYLAFCSALPDGRQRVANLLFVHDLARQFGEFHKQGLRRFLAFLQSLEDQSDLGLPPSAGDPGNVVRIMSIHQSKGLEFPIVFLPDLGKGFNTQDAGGTMIVDRDAGVCPQVVDLPRRARWDSLASLLAKRRIRRQLSAEELRVLYVATTRARRKLVMMGTTDDPAEATESWKSEWSAHSGPLPAETVLAARSMLGWIGPAAAAIDVETPRAITTHVYDQAEVSAAIERAARQRSTLEPDEGIRKFQPLSPAPTTTDAARAALEDLTWRLPTADLSIMPAARAVTLLTKSGRATEGGESPSLRPIVRFAPPLPMPRFLDPDRAASATESGTATHRVLQAIDLTCPATETAVRGQIAQLLARRSITRRDADSVDAAAVAWFLASELGQLMRGNTSAVFRELPLFSPAPTAMGLFDDPRDRVMLRGQIDALVRAPQGLIVIDYKTDRVTDQTLAGRIDFYRPQVSAYCEAISAITSQPVAAAHLVFLVPRCIVTV